MPSIRISQIDGHKQLYTSNGVLTGTSKLKNVSISVSDPGAPSGSWNGMQLYTCQAEWLS